MTFIDSVVVFIASLILGAIGIHVAAMLIVGKSDYWDALWTALIGAVVMAVVGFFLGGVPIIGPLLGLVAWIWVINSRYQGSWGNAIMIGLFAWGTVIITLYFLAVLGVTGFDAIGVPGV